MKDELPNLRHIRLALAIAEGQSLRSAAKALSLTQPAASLAIASLETFYSASLFERRPNCLSATDAGRMLARRALRCMFFVGNAIGEIIKQRDAEETITPRILASITTSQLTAIAGMHQQDNFRAASEFVGLRPATLQKSVSALEGILGSTLTDRNRAGAQLNIAGRAFSSWAGRAVAELSAIAADIRELDGHISGSVSIGAIRVSAAEIVPQVIAEVSQLAPDARFYVMQANYQVMLEALRGGTIDYLCSTVRDTIPPDIDGEIVGQAKLKVFCSPRHVLAGRTDISIDDLLACKWVGPAFLTGAAKAFRQVFESKGIAPPCFAVETTSTDVTEYLVRTGSFLAVANTLDASQPVSSEFRQLDIGDLTLIRPMWLLYRRGWEPTKLQSEVRKAFIRGGISITS